MKKPRKIFSQLDYDAGYHHGTADMFKTFSDALTAVGIKVMAEPPYLELRGNRVVMLFRAILLNQDDGSIITTVVDDRHRSPATPAPSSTRSPGHETGSG